MAIMSFVLPFSVPDFAAEVQIPSTKSFSVGLRSNPLHSNTEMIYSVTLNEGQSLLESLPFNSKAEIFVTSFNNTSSHGLQSVCSFGDH